MLVYIRGPANRLIFYVKSTLLFSDLVTASGIVGCAVRSASARMAAVARVYLRLLPGVRELPIR